MDIKAIAKQKAADEKKMRELDLKSSVGENTYGRKEREFEIAVGKQERIMDSARATDAQKRKAEHECDKLQALITKNMRDYERTVTLLDREYWKLNARVEAAEKKIRSADFAIQRVALLKAQKLLLIHGDGDKPSAKIIEQVIKQLSVSTDW